MNMDYMDAYCYSNIPGTEVPLDHMDYGYVSGCKDLKELGQILKILRSGKLGHYPELIAHTEKRVAELDPNSKLLIKNKPAQRMTDLPREELEGLNKDMESWSESVNNVSGSSEHQEEEDKTLPPIRTQAVNSAGQTPPPPDKSSEDRQERIKSYDFDSWSKYDVNKEAAKVDRDDPPPPSSTEGPSVPTGLTQREQELSSDERERMANREKEKGNEAFRAGDLEEAFAYYSRSIEFNPSVAAYNNRAITEIKQKKYFAAVDDCTSALKMEPSNTKALFRRGTAYSQLGKLHQAATDLERVLHFEPNNKKAQQELNIVRRKLTESGGQKEKKKKVQIVEETDDSEPLTTPTAESAKTTQTTPNHLVSAESAHATPATATNEQSAKSATSAPPPLNKTPPPLPQKVQTLKDEGNKLFKAGQYPDALEKYSLGITVLQTGGKEHKLNVSMLLNNRAACQLKIGDCQACIRDCTDSLLLNVLNVKAFMRRAQAYEHLERYKQAYNDYQLALSIDRSLTPAYEASNRLVRLLRDLDGSGWRDKLPNTTEALRVKAELLYIASLHEVKGQEQPTTTSVQEGSLSVEDTAQTDGGEPDQLTSSQSANSAEQEPVEDVNTQAPSDEPVKSEPNDVTSDPSETATEPETVTAPMSQTKVTQSTQSIPSARTSSPPSPKVKDDLLSPEEKFEQYKLKGNTHMKKGEYVEALRYYNMCVNVSPNKVVGYTNRALCHLKLNSPRSAETDCNRALSFEPGNVKALYRRGLARKAMSRFAESVKDLHLLLTIDPDNSTAQKELGEAKQLWEKQLRDMQANTSPNKPEQRRKGKGGKKNKSEVPPRNGSGNGPKKAPTKEEIEKFQKLVKDLEASKEKIAQLSKMGPPGTMWGNTGGGEFPFTGPPSQPQGKNPNGDKKASPPLGKSPNGSKKAAKQSTNGRGKSSSGGKPKTKKVPKKPPKVALKTEPKIEPEVKGQNPEESSKVEGQNPPVSKGKRIEIEEINSSDAESEATPTKTTLTPPAADDQPSVEDEPSDQESPPPLRSPFEFVQRWNAVSRTAKSSEYARLLESIPPSSLPEVITNKLDGIMLTNIIRAVDKQFVAKGKYNLCVDVLTNLSKVPRFDMVTMFMGPQEKADLSNALGTLSAQSSVPASSIDSIRQMYKL